MGSAPFSANLEVENTSVLLALSGPQSRLLGELARHSGAEVNLRGNTILLSGDEPDVKVAHRFLSDAALLVERGVEIGPHDVAHSVRSLRGNPEASLTDLLDEIVLVSPRRRPVVPKGPTQRRYVEAIRMHDLTFGVVPAGTGKTYLAMAVAKSALMQRTVKLNGLPRPA